MREIKKRYIYSEITEEGHNKKNGAETFFNIIDSFHSVMMAGSTSRNFRSLKVKFLWLVEIKHICQNTYSNVVRRHTTEMCIAGYNIVEKLNLAVSGPYNS